MPEVSNCPKCSGDMQRGFILEQNFNKVVPNVWVEGPPEPSFWTMTKVWSKVKRLVETHRCVKCGFLESFAEVEWTEKVNPDN